MLHELTHSSSVLTTRTGAVRIDGKVREVHFWSEIQKLGIVSRLKTAAVWEYFAHDIWTTPGCMAYPFLKAPNVG